MSYCSNCGSELQVGAIFCSNCGTRILAVQQQPADYSQNAPTYAPNTGTIVYAKDNMNPRTGEDEYPNPYVNPNANIIQNPYGNPNPNSLQNPYGNPNPSTAQNPYGNPNPNFTPYSNYISNQYAGQSPYDNLYMKPNTNNSPGSVRKGKKNIGLIIGIGAAAVFAVIVLFVIIIAVVVLRSPAYEIPVKNMINAIEKGDYDKFIACYPDYLKDYYEEGAEAYGYDVEDYMDNMINNLESEYGDHIKISYKITDKVKLGENDLSEIEDNIDTAYDQSVNIKAGYTLEIETTVEGSEEEDTDSDELTVIKIGSKWYVADDIFN